MAVPRLPEHTLRNSTRRLAVGVAAVECEWACQRDR